jgi:hypothetical protein
MLADWREMLIKIGSFRDATCHFVPKFHEGWPKNMFYCFGNKAITSRRR